MSGFKVNFSVNNQLATPSIHAAALANRPAAGQPGRVFIDTDNPSTGIYRDTGTIWVQIAETSDPEADTLQTVTDRGNTTTQDIAIGTSSTPSAPLDVHGTDTIAILQGTGTSNAFLQFNKSGNGKFKTGNVHNGGNDYFTVYNMQENADAILVNISTNNVAIGGGVVAPSYRLDVQGSLRTTGAAYLGTGGSDVGINTVTPGSFLGGTNGLAINFSGVSNGLAMSAGGSNNVIQVMTASAQFYWYAGGLGNRAGTIFTGTGNWRFGTGTSDNGVKLQVNGGVDASGAITCSGQMSCNFIATNLVYTNAQEANTGNMAIRTNIGASRTISFGDSATNLGANEYMRFFPSNTIPGIGTGSVNLIINKPTINQTTGTGTIYGYRFNPTNTAVLSKVYAFYADSGNVNFSGLPTSSAGLATGDLWNDSGTLKIA